MAHRPSKRRHHPVRGEELNLTPIMNIFMIIIPFVLLTAVFARTAIIDIYLPQEGQSGTEKSAGAPELLTVKITEKGFELGGMGKGIFVSKTGNELNFPQLTKELVKLKDKYPKEEEVILLFYPDTSYDTVVKLMDATRESVEEKEGQIVKRPLFPLASLGENN